MSIPSSSFYSAKKHEKTQESAERLLELIADGNVSDIGESDEEDTTCELTESVVAPELADIVDDEDAVEEGARNSGEIEDSAVSKTVPWKKRNFAPPLIIAFSGEDTFTEEEEDALTPFNYFSRYVPQSVFKCLTDSTNLYSVQQCQVSVNTNPDEMRKLFGMHVLMGVIPHPRVRMYWQSTARVALISETMTAKRFFKLRNNLHAARTDFGKSDHF